MHDVKKKAVEAALNLAVEQGWSEVSMSAIAVRAGIGLDVLHDYFEDRDDVLCHYGRMVDSAVIGAFQGQELEGESPRERLFDILMERFDVLNDHRDAVLEIMAAYRFDPKKGALALPHVARSMVWMMDLAGLHDDGWRGGVKILGLTALYLDIAFRVWSKDDSPDLTKTMAALDRALNRAEQIVGSVGL